jgi:hypothetical protein
MEKPCAAGAQRAIAETGLSLAEVLQAALPAYRQECVLLPEQWKVIRAITGCRTPALGAHCYQCRQCGRTHCQYHSCRNRHCPVCQSHQAAEWLDRQESSLLPTPYFHVVFTLPHRLNALIRQNRAALYKLLFQSASQTLLEFGQRRLGGQIGVTAVLHTWGQNLSDHYHLHCLVTGGALSPDRSRWKSAAAHYLFPVRALSKVFRGKFLAGLRSLHSELEFHGELNSLAAPEPFQKLCRQCSSIPWVVYAKKPFAGPEQVLRYLSLYTHRVALSQRRLLRLDRAAQTVTFSYKDYAQEARRKEMTLSLGEFMRRFLLHLLPKGFVKIRHFGLLGTHGRAARIAQARSLIPPLPESLPRSNPPPPTPAALLVALRWKAPRCPFCHSPELALLQVVRPAQGKTSPGKWDSS